MFLEATIKDIKFGTYLILDFITICKVQIRADVSNTLYIINGTDGARTRDLLRDRQAF